MADRSTLTAYDLKEALWEYKPRSYSGRFMYGDSCVAVVADDVADLVTIGWHLAHYFGEDRQLPTCRVDSLGRGIILYWPDVAWPADLDLAEACDND